MGKYLLVITTHSSEQKTPIIKVSKIKIAIKNSFNLVDVESNKGVNLDD